MFARDAYCGQGIAAQNDTFEPPARKRRKLDDSSAIDVDQVWGDLQALNSRLATRRRR
jgi:hypothetical protein